MYLIAAETTTLAWIWVIFQVAAGLGAVIFVHELGHFLVAKACGVKCEKFYIGFDIGGYKICHQWGETEYGIGILPMGGYVKMLGQDDNPARMAEEAERSKIPVDDATATADADPGSPSPDAAEDYVLNPRSYMAKSVPQRMAIISAGVIMNLIFALVFAAVAYGMGVDYLPAIVSRVVPGSPAWRADLRPGDEIVEIGGLEYPRFRDLRGQVALGDLEQGIPATIRRPGQDETISMTLRPEHSGSLVPTIGVISPLTLTLIEPLEGSPLAHATPELLAGDRITALDGTPVANHAELLEQLSTNPDKPMQVTVSRGASAADDDPDAQQSDDIAGDSAEVEVVATVAANPMKRLGVVMSLGPIEAVQIGSPAAVAGLVAGDLITKIDGVAVGDPMTFADRLRLKAIQGESVELTIERNGAGEQAAVLDVTIPLRIPRTFEPATVKDAPVSIPALGVTCRVPNRVASVVPGSPADKAGIAAGDVVVQTSFVATETPSDDSAELTTLAKRFVEMDAIKFTDTQRNWPAVVDIMQSIPDSLQVHVVVDRGESEQTFDVTPVATDEWFNPDRGLATAALRYTRTAETFSEQVQLGFAETVDSASMVFRFLQKLVGGQISARALGGPVTIAKAAGYSAFDGVPSLLIFLTMLSANLAVVNFLPIPLLDGGHMVFLTLEGIFRRPVSERIVVAFHTVGFVFIISLMLFVLALDFGLISRVP